MNKGHVIKADDLEVDWAPIPTFHSAPKTPILYQADGTPLTKGPIGFQTKEK